VHQVAGQAHQGYASYKHVLAAITPPTTLMGCCLHNLHGCVILAQNVAGLCLGLVAARHLQVNNVIAKPLHQSRLLAWLVISHPIVGAGWVLVSRGCLCSVHADTTAMDRVRQT
jgi:hypothetical protein